MKQTLQVAWRSSLRPTTGIANFEASIKIVNKITTKIITSKNTTLLSYGEIVNYSSHVLLGPAPMRLAVSHLPS